MSAVSRPLPGPTPATSLQPDGTDANPAGYLPLRMRL